MQKKADKAKHQEFLEDFFDLANYQECQQWNLNDWFNALDARRAFSVLWKKSEAAQSNIKGLLELFVQVTAEIIKDPLRESGAYPLPQTPLREISVGDLDTLSNLVCSLKIELEADMSVSNLAIKAGMTDNHFNHLSNKVFAQFNLSASDEMLEKRFKEFIKSSRERYGVQPVKSVKPIFCQKNFSDWHSQRVLPYIDLFSWNKARGTPLSSEEMIEILDLEDVKTVRSKAISLLSQENLHAMNLQLSRYWS